VIEEDGKERSVYRTVSSGGSFGANPLRQHLGLGKATALRSLEVLWPATGETQVFTGIPLDRYVEIVEGVAEPEVHELTPVTLGGGKR
jgi:hypothetical protein